MVGFLQEYFAKGKASALARLLERRFGSVPARVQERILSADLVSLEAWFDRAIDAPDLQSIFGSN
jgi:hypothetical protein